MNFFVLYFYIPLFVFIANPIKENRFFALYLFLLVVLSYDNTTDFFIYFEEFQRYLNSMDSADFNDKGREFGWMQLMKLFSFSEYGIVMLHMLILCATILSFLKYSSKLGLLNVSVLLYFIFDIITLHDNILRHDIAIIIGFWIYFNIVVSDEEWSPKRFVLFFLLVFVGSLFHFSAVLIIPYAILVNWFSKVRLKFLLVFPIIFVVGLVMLSGIIERVLGAFFFLFLLDDNAYTEYYASLLLDQEAGGVGLVGFILCLMSALPLFYFSYFSPELYQNNKFVRLSVNATCFVMAWKMLFLHINELSRIADYLVWFQVWGFGFMIKDMITNKQMKLVRRFSVIIVLVILCFDRYRIIDFYYGDNNYMTIFTEECYDLRLYTRTFDTENADFTRIR